MASDNKARMTKNQNRTENDDENLWEDLEIDFRLEALEFPDNKIYGIVNIKPESSRRLIQKFVLIVNKVNEIEFQPDFYYLAAAGFNTNKRKPWAYVKAIPIDKNWTKGKEKISQTCCFYFNGEVFALSPTIHFVWETIEKKREPVLVIKWYHLGDKIAQRYILYLDNIEIQHIRQKVIRDEFNISIRSFTPGDKHTLQLAAKLNNGKETYRSDLQYFTVPETESVDNEFITVSNQRAPADLPAVVHINDDNEEQTSPRSPRIPNERNNSIIHTCCNHLPHDTFPGIDHYFNDNNDTARLSSPRKQTTYDNNNHKQSLARDKRTPLTEKSEEDEMSDDDDEDVVTPKTKK